jgi:Ion transport protein
VQRLLDWANYALSICFLVEFLIKVIAFSWDYFLSGWNIVDFIVIVTSCIDFILTMTTGSNSITSGVKIVRSFRIVRILKLLRRFKEL